MRNWVFAFVVGLAGCAEDHASGSCGDLSWLTKLENSITANGRKGEVSSAMQNNEPVYIVNGCINCNDYPTILYDCKGKEICQSGGLIGGNCSFPAAKTLIWKNY